MRSTWSDNVLLWRSVGSKTEGRHVGIVEAVHRYRGLPYSGQIHDESKLPRELAFVHTPKEKKDEWKKFVAKAKQYEVDHQRRQKEAMREVQARSAEAAADAEGGGEGGGGGESAAASDGEGCVDDDALAAERASAFGISISGCKRGKVMGLCAYPEGSGACPVTCGTCGQ